jgi:hypothetical protein
VGEIVKGGDFSSEAVLAILGRDNRGESASERVDRITATTDPKCVLHCCLFKLVLTPCWRAQLGAGHAAG